MSERSTQGRAVVIGAGAVGLATASALARSGVETVILEKGPRIAEGVTSRNSGVIHSPLNYPTDSLKAQLCARGRELLYSWCEKKGVPHRQTGKLIIATHPREEAELERIHAAAAANGAPEARLITPRELHEIEPNATGTTALLSPRTGIVDPYELSRTYLLDAEQHGAILATRAEVIAVEEGDRFFLLQTSVGPIEAHWVINSAGLHADEVAALAGTPKYKIYPWRGDYFSFRPGRDFNHLIYPVKMKSDPGLGVHLTMDLHGKLRLGPDAEFSVSKADFSAREDKKEIFAAAARKLFPWTTPEMLRYDTCGIRPKLRSPDGTEEKDFVISQDLPGWINLIGIESPGLTASLAIAERVLAMIEP